MQTNPLRLFPLLLLGAAIPAGLPAATLTVAFDRPGAQINPAMWGGTGQEPGL